MSRCSRQGPLRLLSVAALGTALLSARLFSQTEAFGAQRPGPQRTWKPLSKNMIEWIELNEKGLTKPPKPPPSPEELELEQFEGDLAACAEDGAWLRAADFLETMKERGVKRSTKAFNYALRACAKDFRWEEASKLIETMWKDDVPPDHMSYLHFMEACGQPSTVGKVTEIMQEMSRRGLVPNVNTYMKAMEILMKMGLEKKADALLTEAGQRGMLSVWTNDGNVLDLRDLTVEVAKLVTRFAVEERAIRLTGRKAGRGGFSIVTGHANSKKTAIVQNAVLNVLREEYDLKVRMAPTSFGRVYLSTTALTELGMERKFADKYTTRARLDRA